MHDMGRLVVTIYAVGCHPNPGLHNHTVIDPCRLFARRQSNSKERTRANMEADPGSSATVWGFKPRARMGRQRGTGPDGALRPQPSWGLAGLGKIRREGGWGCKPTCGVQSVNWRGSLGESPVFLCVTAANVGCLERHVEAAVRRDVLPTNDRAPIACCLVAAGK